MKTIMITMVFLTGIISFGQRGERHTAMSNLSSEQIATLKTKKLDLALDLSEKQEGLIYELQLEKAQMRKTKKEEVRSRDSRPDADEKFALMSKKLDMKIENKEKMKSILDKEQFAKWEKLKHKKSSRSRCRAHRGK